MPIPPLLTLRIVVVLSGLMAGGLLVRALDQGLAGQPRSFTGMHALLGALVGLVVMPGPVLGFFVTPLTGERARGLAVGGSAVTALAALLGGALLYRRVFLEGGTGFTEFLAFGWCPLALVLAALDFFRLRGGAGGGGNG